MLLKTIVTIYPSDKIEGIKAEMLKLGLAQNVSTPLTEWIDRPKMTADEERVLATSNIEGDWVDPTKLGMSYGTYLNRVKVMQLLFDCMAHVEVK